ncbi:MAG: peptidylprolyl isomerase [Balneolaceae bacterium]|nr:peptidylprolyl isomerase [Balneolaceae bacterium]
MGQSRQILNYLENASQGDISQPLELSSQFVVLKVEEITPAGVRPFEEVQQQVRNAVLNEKRKQQVAQRVEDLLASNSSIDALASASGKEVVSQQGLRKSSVVVEEAGREPEIVGSVFGLDEGETSGVLQGNSAVFVVHVGGEIEADLQNLTTSMRQQIRQQLQQEKSKSYTQVWIDQLRTDADIVDNRSQLFQQG